MAAEPRLRSVQKGPFAVRRSRADEAGPVPTPVGISLRKRAWAGGAALAIAQFSGSGSLLAEYREIESGKSPANRPKLAAARNVLFISGLMKGGVDFVTVDMPQANRLPVHILAAVAGNEREGVGH